MSSILSREFYTQPTLAVAKALLGKYILRRAGKKIFAGKIIETEAYIGPQDKASHAYLPYRLRSWPGQTKRTPRNEAEFLQGGHIYIYLVYGMYWQLNITTWKEDTPECILIRALDMGQEIKRANGPGKLCGYLKLNKSFNEEDITQSKRIWLEDRGEKVSPVQILATGRIGIDYAGSYWARRKWRFLLKEYKKFLPKL